MRDAYPVSALSPSQARQIVQACDRFEAAWKAGPRPQPAEYLGPDGEPARSALLYQLLLMDWDYRRRAGDAPRAGDYHARFPGDPALVDDVDRTMAEPAASTREAADARHTPWSGDGATAPPGEADTDAGTGADRYDLTQEVGRGGIGVVYRSRDRRLGRELAVKVLRETYRDQPEARRRFIAEARVGSQLQHPAIVPVYEQGCFADGRPYFTMKLVQGHTLAQLLRDRAGPSQDLPRLLGVFEQVCQAMAYAHTQGVIHRDLKPANVMVGAFGEVQVMDWGFAKLLGGGAEAGYPVSPTSDGVSQSGALMGTPAYMPPEQAQGHAALIDARADVFALGAILCEILTGRPPYASVSSDDVWRQATAGDLADAHARLDACGADAALRELAGRCLAAERPARPADAAAVAQGVTAYLASAQERLRQAQLDRAAAEARAKAERRARQLTVALAAALFFGSGVAVWQAVVATQAKQEALAAAVLQKEAKETANAKEAETGAVLDFVRDRVFAAPRPEGQDGGLGHDVTLRHALEAVLPVVDKSFASQPLIEARLRMTLAASFYHLGEAKIAADQYQKVRALYTEHRGPDHPDTLASMNNLANAYAALGQYADAIKIYETLLALRKVRLGPDHPVTLSSMSNLAAMYNSVGRYPHALQLGEETLALKKARLGPDHLDTLDSMGNLAYTYAALGRPADAVKLTEETLALRKAKQGPHHPATLMSMVNLANGYSALGRHADALQLREETLALQKAKLPPNHPDTLWTMHNLANSYANLDRLADALQLREETLALREAKLGRTHPDTLRSMKALAESLVQLDRGAEAVSVIDDCVRRSTGQVVHPKLIPGVMDLRLRHFEKAKDVQGCRATADLWESLQHRDVDSLYTAARFRAVTATLLRTPDSSAEAAREADAEADRAMAWLTQAVAARYKDVANLKKDAYLDALRDRADFQKLLAAVQAGGG